ncbi:hypothetical protein [Cryobacterium sp. Hz9]|uniref:hypothetical protein n=1 Tax=Cryobacterium sp. Hz9 TaxID=1259167 RepID=UPI001068F8B8|nr:hypothetical protein [Cryobacterium sp. Hz9]TFB67366.1 hypothetical protein E3N85_06925 [Cryobacterium sp. Hz9]
MQALTASFKIGRRALVVISAVSALLLIGSIIVVQAALRDTVVSDDFSNDADGYKTETDSGHPVVLFPSGSPRTPRVKDGWLAFDERYGVLGSYYIVEVPKVRNASVDFTFTPWSQGGGLFCLAFMEEDLSKTFPEVPRSPMHLTVSPTNWSLDVFDTKGDQLRTVADGAFQTPLIADGIITHAVSVSLDPENGAVKLTLPTGQVVEVSDPAFKVIPNFAYIESWRTTADTAETLAKVRAWQADANPTFNARDK